MASISTTANGTRRIYFIDKNGSRKTLYAGRISLRHAEKLKTRVEQLVEASITGDMETNLAQWVMTAGEDIYAKLASVGLVKPRTALTLGAFIDQFIAERNATAKESTRTVYKRVRRYLVGHFTEGKPLRQIHEGDGDDWRLYLEGKGLSPNTIRRACGIAKQFLRSAVRKKLIPSNPFADFKGGVRGNEARAYFVSREDAQKVLDACPDAQWRLIFALCRYGGLRCPSEILPLTWSDVDWEGGRLRVTSPKTEHHEGKAERMVPIFPELRTYLLEVFEQAAPGMEYVITRYRQRNANLRTQLERIIKRAGLTPWPKLFQNLRSTRETELADAYPIHVVCAWIGNSAAVAKKHYLQVTDEHFGRAVGEGGKATLQTTHGVTQKTTSQPSAESRSDEQSGEADDPKALPDGEFCDDVRESAELCEAGAGSGEWAVRDSNP